MFKRYWIAITAIGLGIALVACAAFVLAKPYWAGGDNEGRSGEIARQSDQQGPIGAIPYHDPAGGDCDPDQQECREARDLAAQEGMNRATNAMVWLSGGGLFVAAIGTFLLYLTWREAQKVTADTRRIGEAQTRAYVSVSELLVRFNENKNLVLSPAFHNSGQSPALNVSYSVTASYGLEVKGKSSERCAGPSPIGHIASAKEREDPLEWSDLNPPEPFYRLLLSDEPNEGAFVIDIYTTFWDVFGCRYSIRSTFMLRPHSFEIDGEFEPMGFIAERDAAICEKCQKDHNITRFDAEAHKRGSH